MWFYGYWYNFPYIITLLFYGLLKIIIIGMYSINFQNVIVPHPLKNKSKFT